MSLKPYFPLSLLLLQLQHQLMSNKRSHQALSDRGLQPVPNSGDYWKCPRCQRELAPKTFYNQPEHPVSCVLNEHLTQQQPQSPTSPQPAGQNGTDPPLQVSPAASPGCQQQPYDTPQRGDPLPRDRDGPRGACCVCVCAFLLS
jgi:hypothetical protein